MMKSLLSSKRLQFLVAFTLLCEGFQLKSCADSNPTYNPLDIGAVYNCTVPTNLSFCSMITYPVPEAVANRARVWETLAENEYEPIKEAAEIEKLDECLAEAKERLCGQYFPRCYLDEQVVNVEVSNKTECLSSCKSIENSCNDFYFRPNSSLGPCKLASEYANEYNYTFAVCGESADKRFVTEWMFHYLRREDRVLKESGVLLQSDKCLQDYFSFKCEEIGRCWDQGRRIEISKNMTECNRLMTPDCFNNQQLENIVEKELVCDGYPNAEPLITEPTMISTSPSTTTNTTTSTPVGTIRPTTSPALTLGQPNSSSAVRSQLPMLSLLIISCTVIRRLLTQSYT